MRLHSLRIEGLRKHIDTTVLFSEATFLIGGNNIGKSTVLKALEYLLKDQKKLSDEEFFSLFNDDLTDNTKLVDQIVITAQFRNLPEDSLNWRGFKSRILSYETNEFPDETGLMIEYRKTFRQNKDYVVEMKQYITNLKECYESCLTLQDYIDNGLSEDIVSELFPVENKEKKLTKKLKDKLLELDELYEIDVTKEDWFKNPGGIPGNVLSKLPKFLLIPAQDKVDELSGNKGALIETLNSLFDDVRSESETFAEVERLLGLLQQELNPEDTTTEFGKMMEELNGILGDVFPNTKLLARANLSDANKVVKPQFEVEMGSNAKTPVENQGTGVIRSAVFAMLRYRSMRENVSSRPIIVGFEEPEIYLHPNAAHQMRDTIYELASQPNNQIVSTTHSPFMIDLSRKSSQVLNNLYEEDYEITYNEEKYQVDKICSEPFNVTGAFLELQEDDKEYVKMIVKMDDYMAKVFFSKNVLIVEGDTEDIVLRETISILPYDVRKSIQNDWQIVKARGKATIISLVRYLKAMGINPVVMHDKDEGTEGAEKFNKPIEDAVGHSNNVHQLENCMEDVLGYPVPSSEKPLKAYKFIKENWAENWENVTPSWKEKVKTIFFRTFENQHNEIEPSDEVSLVQQVVETI